MRLFLHQLRFEQRLFWRSRDAAIFTFAVPVALFLVLGAVTRDSDRSANPFLLSWTLGFGVGATAFTGLAITLVIRREYGFLKRIRVTPIPAAVYFGAVLASLLLVFALEAAAMIVLGRSLFDIGLPDRPWSLVAALVVGAASLAALGVAMTGGVRSAQGSSAVVNAVWLAMLALSGPAGDYPRFLRPLAEVAPLGYFVRMVRAIVFDDRAIWQRWGDLAVLAAWGLLGAAIARRSFRWEPREG